MLQHDKFPIGHKDKNGVDLCYGNMVEKNGEKDWFVAYRYGETMLKKVGQMAMLGLKDYSTVEKLNVIGAGPDWLIIGHTDEPFYDKVKDLEGVELV